MTRLKKLISATLALSLLGGGAATAQTFGRGGQPQNNRGTIQDNRGVPQTNRGFNPGTRGIPQTNRGFPQDNRGFDRNRGGNFSFGFGVGPGFGSGYGPGFRYDPFHRAWRVGQRFSPYGTHFIVVNDWYRYHLRRPPYGYHWVQVNGDYLLIGITSGIIADLLLGHNYY